MAYTPKKFSALTSATLPLTGVEVVVLVDRKTTTKDMADLALNRPTTIKTASYTPVIADANSLIQMDLAGANTFTLPLNATVAFAIGSRLRVFQRGAGVTTIAATAGVTILCARTLALRAQYSVVELIKVAADEWILSGDLT